jgi:hypothetical protein
MRLDIFGSLVDDWHSCGGGTAYDRSRVRVGVAHLADRSCDSPVPVRLATCAELCAAIQDGIGWSQPKSCSHEGASPSNLLLTFVCIRSDRFRGAEMASTSSHCGIGSSSRLYTGDEPGPAAAPLRPGAGDRSSGRIPSAAGCDALLCHRCALGGHGEIQSCPVAIWWFG